MTRRTLATFSSLAALWMVLPKHGAVAISPYSEMDQHQFSVRALSRSGLNRTSSSNSLSVVLAVAAFRLVFVPVLYVCFFRISVPSGVVGSN